MSLEILSQPVIVISSLEVAAELFEKRGAIYSDRHTSVMANELYYCLRISLHRILTKKYFLRRCITDWLISFMKYGDRWRRSRKFYHQHFGHAVLGKYDRIQTEKLRIFLKRIHESPHRYIDHCL